MLHDNVTNSGTNGNGNLSITLPPHCYSTRRRACVHPHAATHTSIHTRVRTPMHERPSILIPFVNVFSILSITGVNNFQAVPARSLRAVTFSGVSRWFFDSRGKTVTYSRHSSSSKRKSRQNRSSMISRIIYLSCRLAWKISRAPRYRYVSEDIKIFYLDNR